MVSLVLVLLFDHGVSLFDALMALVLTHGYIVVFAAVAVNLIPDGPGTIRVGDRVTAME